MDNNNQPLVSVIVTTYNRQELLKETIDSILAQTFTDFELIVVDNYSNYDFNEHIQSFNDKRIRSFQNQNNGIIALNRNIGIKAAKGEYIAFCDDDDLWVKEKLQKQIDIFDKYDVIAVGSLTQGIGVLRYHRKKTIKSHYKTGMVNFDDIIKGNSTALSSLIMKKQKGILFNVEDRFLYVEDFLLQLNLTVSKSNLFIINEKLVNYRYHENNSSSQLQKAENILQVYDFYKDYLGIEFVKNIKYSVYYNIGLTALRSNNTLEAKRFYRKAIKTKDLKLKIMTFSLFSFCFLPLRIRTIALESFYSKK